MMIMPHSGEHQHDLARGQAEILLVAKRKPDVEGPDAGRGDEGEDEKLRQELCALVECIGAEIHFYRKRAGQKWALSIEALYSPRCAARFQLTLCSSARRAAHAVPISSDAYIWHCAISGCVLLGKLPADRFQLLLALRSGTGIGHVEFIERIQNGLRND